MSLTQQEVFDKSTLGIIEQGCKPAIDHDSCLYRVGARKCAAGHLISDAEYSEMMEDMNISEVIKEWRLTHLSKHSGLLGALQKAHDKTLYESGIEAWKTQLLLIADRYGLNTEVLKKIPA